MFQISKNVLILLTILIVNIAQRARKTSRIPPPPIWRKKSVKDFDSSVKLVVHEGQLKGEYLFKNNPESYTERVFINIDHQRGPGNKNDATTKVNLSVNSLKQVNGNFVIKLAAKKFTGMIKPGQYPILKSHKDKHSSIPSPSHHF